MIDDYDEPTKDAMRVLVVVGDDRSVAKHIAESLKGVAVEVCVDTTIQETLPAKTFDVRDAFTKKTDKHRHDC